MTHFAVFCGASSGHDPVYMEAARQVGLALAERGLGVVYGGGHVGLMGAVADAAMEAGGNVVGVIPGFMTEKEVAHERVSELIMVKDMHERKLVMHQRSQAVIALPGGFGTMDELFELLTWRQLGLHAKPMGVLNVNGFYDPLLDQANRMKRDGFLHGATRILSHQDVDGLIDDLLGRIVRV
ncbi:MAG: TIGR00730 family Rossman fold protein [Flavobacteriales bacterium]|nr:TIGR00730 family Rossman fold protein [Flavobacteriales bacterium]MCB0814427.1 TIGR00730 family Rossman fold protein [Flavobacteriales bacterium]